MDRWSTADLQKIVVSADGKTLLGGVLVGDAGDYATLLQMMLNGMALPSRPESLILPAMDGATTKALGVAALPDSAQICSCHNVSKGDICRGQRRSGRYGGDKSCTKAATGCGGCSALVKQVMEHQLAGQGVEVKKISASIFRGRGRRFIIWYESTTSIPSISSLAVTGRATAVKCVNRWWRRYWPPAGMSIC